MANLKGSERNKRTKHITDLQGDIARGLLVGPIESAEDLIDFVHGRSCTGGYWDKTGIALWQEYANLVATAGAMEIGEDEPGRKGNATVDLGVIRYPTKDAPTEHFSAMLSRLPAW